MSVFAKHTGRASALPSDQLEHYTQARIGGNHPPETTGKFIAAKFEHDTARPVDGYVAPQLHTHVVIFNMTERADGETRALQERGLFQSQQFATAIYQSELTYRVRQLGYEITTGRSGAPRSRATRRNTSTHPVPAASRFVNTSNARAVPGRKPPRSPRTRRATARKFIRRAKLWLRTGSWQQTLGTKPTPLYAQPVNGLNTRTEPVNSLDRVRESVTFSRDKNFEREAVVDERALIRDGLRRGMGEITHAQVRTNLDARLASGEFQIVERSQGVPGRQFTTAKTIEAEHEILYRMREGQNDVGSVLPRPLAIAFADQHSNLNRAQKTVVEDVLSSPDRIQGIQGFAGSGKTTTLTVIRSAAEGQGYQVEGFAPTSRAARQLKEAGIEAGTLQAFLVRGQDNERNPEQKRLFFIDESSLASTNQMREFLSRLGASDRVLLVGDTRQHQGVEAGRPFEQLQEAGMRTAKLDEIVRQQDPALKSAVELLATGQVSAALDSLQQQGRVMEIPNAEERVRTIAKCYLESPENTLIVSPDNASRRELNVAVRQELKAAGRLATEDHSFRVLVQRQDMTGAERSWASHYEINDVVRYTRGSKAIGIEAAAYASVVVIDPSTNRLTVEKANGELATYDPRRLTGVSVYQEIDREFSVGDRIQFTAPDKSLGVANRDLAVIESIAPNGHITARVDNSRQIEFDASQYRHFDQGYAVTSHSSQGLTAERVLVHGDTSVHPDLLNSRFAYVSISRASLDAKIYTSDAADLGQKLSGEVSKSSAIEFSHSTANAMTDLSLGQGI